LEPSQCKPPSRPRSSFLIAFALPKITEDFGLSTFQSSVVVASTFVGMLAGAWFWGTVSDRIGRKRGLTITIGIFAIFGFLFPRVHPEAHPSTGAQIGASPPIGGSVVRGPADIILSDRR
jgi:MFS family permease